MEIDNYSVINTASSRHCFIEYLEKNVGIFHKQFASHIASRRATSDARLKRVCVCACELLGFAKAEN